MEADEELVTIAAEQRRELCTALVQELDHDIAYRLQIEEAIAASLSLEPSSSSYQKMPEASIRNDEEDIDASVTTLQIMELDKFQREIQDRALVEADKKKVHEDLHRRIHDQKLARELDDMSDDEWEDIGDYLERPFGEGSSSTNGEVSSEVFRVYFKGLLSEERVKRNNSLNKTVTMAGIGVAICDSSDNLIFEMRKPLDLDEHDRMSRQIVEGKALIEALNSAAALDLKRIVFYCDYYTLYQFVSGRWQPKQQKVKTLVDNVNLIRKNFISCEPSLVTRNDVKFASKLAREAITSQLNKLAESIDDINCVICLEDKSANQFFSVEGCKHQYCYSCMKQHVEVKLLNGMVPKCPHKDCNSELKTESCKVFLTSKLLEMMIQRLKEASIPVEHKIYCPYPKCSALMSLYELVNKSTNLSGGRSSLMRCDKCCGEFCYRCRVPWHKNMHCNEYRRRNPSYFLEESIRDLAEKNLWYPCVKCRHMIELASGCYHVTCRCGYEFCYVCGAPWENKEATCECRLWDEANIIDSDYEDFDDGDDNDDDDDYDSDTD